MEKETSKQKHEIWQADAILFDKDGTLLDFTVLWGFWADTVLDRFRECLAEQKLILTDEQIPEIWGTRHEASGSMSDYDRRGPLAMGTMEEMNAVLIWQGYRAGLSWAESKMIVQDCMEYADAQMEIVRPARLLPGVQKFLDRCRSEQIPMAVVTADDTYSALQHLRWLGVDHYFGAIIGNDLAERGKPYPDLCLLACQQLGVAPQRVVVIGDTDGDMEMARAAGAALKVGIGEPDVFQLADFTISSFTELLKIDATSAPSVQQQPLAVFQVITDTHVREDASHIHNRHFEEALIDISSFGQKSLGIMHVGDVTDRGLATEYAEFRRIWNSRPRPLPELYLTLGNHDIGAVLWDEGGTPIDLSLLPEYEVEDALDGRLSPVTELVAATEGLDFAGMAERLGSSEPQTISQQARELWTTRMRRFAEGTGEAAPYHDHWLAGYHFIFLGSESPHPKDCDLSNMQLDWLRDRLSEEASPERPIFVFLHQPLRDTVAGSMSHQGWYGVNQNAALQQALAEYPQVILFSGHTHWQLEAKRTFSDGHGTEPSMFNAASVAYLWTDQDQHLIGSQGLHVEVYADQVVVRGRDFVRRCWIPDAEYRVQIPIAASQTTS
ncbi:HAD-IA family hydrolase [Saccharibacillus sp. JS10]|uniref:HAD-IA family hydrolase n=1 Tax=Saccharibacillus sp. JS10 TaxID=2950552 RepID=UPI002108C579|nr:HAD-IA family hydrolase [Saccharibacillus sp. JS10]MCQ4088364.1 HAD-IA family hydrolase [Saccharibacillus sp. JS10]